VIYWGQPNKQLAGPFALVTHLIASKFPQNANAAIACSDIVSCYACHADPCMSRVLFSELPIPCDNGTVVKHAVDVDSEVHQLIYR